MTTFANALKGAGFNVENKCMQLDCMEDLKLPYMHDVMDSACVTIVNYDLFNDCKVIERNRKPLDIEWIKKHRKPVRDEDMELYNWIIEHADKCFGIEYDHYGKITEERLHYGMCCFVFYLSWNCQHRCWEIDYGTENTKESLFHPLWKQPIDYLNYMLENAEFIPVVVDKRQDTYDWVTISDWGNQNWVIGQNIIESKNPDVMREYSRLKEAGFGVNPKGKYFIFPKGNRKHHREGMDVYFKRIKEQKGETSRIPVEEYLDRIVRY
jgi:hypothetical protein